MPHPDAVPMVGHGRGALSTTDRLDVGAFPPLSPHRGFRFSPERRRKSSSYRTPMRYPWWGTGAAHTRLLTGST